jgi:phenylpropionate dioxygenase-like ring-hydroxylating dioxygenase large terminal subunit
MALAKQICPAGQGYPRNHWYVAAWSHEVGQSLFSRQLLGSPVVLYRTEQGEAVALADMCPHRGMPLSLGKLIGDGIQCAYHGLEFDANGRCRKIPSQDQIPPNLCVRRYPLVEKWQWLWIWMGAPEKADPNLIPDHSFIGADRPGWQATPMFCMEIKSNYTLIHENLLDTTHATFMHPGLLDDSGELTDGPFQLEEKDGVIRIYREMDCRPGPGVAALFNVKEGYLYRRTLASEAYPPNLNLARGQFFDPANPDEPPKEFIAAEAITPGGPNTHYVFHGSITSYPFHWTPEAIDYLRNIVAQDKVALEAIQSRYEDLGLDVNEMSVKTDLPGLRFRKRIADMVKQEQLSD